MDLFETTVRWLIVNHLWEPYLKSLGQNPHQVVSFAEDKTRSSYSYDTIIILDKKDLNNLGLKIEITKQS